MNGRSMAEISPMTPAYTRQDTIGAPGGASDYSRRYFQTTIHSEMAYSTQDDTGYKSYGERNLHRFPYTFTGDAKYFSRSRAAFLSIPGDGRRRVDPGRRSSRL